MSLAGRSAVLGGVKRMFWLRGSPGLVSPLSRLYFWGGGRRWGAGREGSLKKGIEGSRRRARGNFKFWNIWQKAAKVAWEGSRPAN